MAVIEFPGIFKRLFREQGESLIVKEPVMPLKENGGIAYDSEGTGLYVNVKDGGGLVVGSDGGISVAIEEGGGLAQDGSGNIYVDFDTMDPTRFEDMLKTLTIPIFLTANKPFYVNGETGNDDISVEGIGESAGKPFKTIQACADYVSTYYNVNSHVATIYVAAGTYDEQLSLGNFSSTTGYIRIMPSDGDQTVTVSNTNTGDLVYISGGNWRFYNMVFHLYAQPHNGNAASHGHTVISAVTGANVSVYDCSIELEDMAETTLGSDWSSMVCANNADITLNNNGGSTRRIAITNRNLFSGNRRCFIAAYGGSLTIMGNNTSREDATWYFSGDYTGILEAWDGGEILYGTGATSLYIARLATEESKTCTGQKYYIRSGSSLNTQGYGVDTGSTEGYVESETYSWVK